MRCLSASIIASQEKERTAIARELHDELGQMLTALRMDTVWLQERLNGDDPRVSERVEAMCKLIDATIDNVRGMAIRMRPGVLDDLGLVDALEWFSADFERRTQIVCIFSHNKIPIMDNTIATATYRIAQEALTNVARHADAHRAEVALRMDHNALSLMVSDDGKGFNPESRSEVDMLGLAGMKERASLVGGKLNMESRPGHGTCVRLRVPLKQHPGKLS